MKSQLRQKDELKTQELQNRRLEEKKKKDREEKVLEVRSIVRLRKDYTEAFQQILDGKHNETVVAKLSDRLVSDGDLRIVGLPSNNTIKHNARKLLGFLTSSPGTPNIFNDVLQKLITAYKSKNYREALRLATLINEEDRKAEDKKKEERKLGEESELNIEGGKLVPQEIIDRIMALNLDQEQQKQQPKDEKKLLRRSPLPSPLAIPPAVSQFSSPFGSPTVAQSSSRVRTLSSLRELDRSIQVGSEFEQATRIYYNNSATDLELGEAERLFDIASSQGNKSAYIYSAASQYKQGKFKEAFDKFSAMPLSDEGISDPYERRALGVASLCLAQIYYYGLGGVPHNIDGAIHHFMQSVKMGNSKAMDILKKIQPIIEDVSRGIDLGRYRDYAQDIGQVVGFGYSYMREDKEGQKGNKDVDDEKKLASPKSKNRPELRLQDSALRSKTQISYSYYRSGQKFDIKEGRADARDKKERKFKPLTPELNNSGDDSELDAYSDVRPKALTRSLPASKPRQMTQSFSMESYYAYGSGVSSEELNSDILYQSRGRGFNKSEYPSRGLNFNKNESQYPSKSPSSAEAISLYKPKLSKSRSSHSLASNREGSNFDKDYFYR